MRLSDMYIYQTLLGYDLNDSTKLQTLKISIRKLRVREIEKKALRVLQKKHDLPLDASWSSRRLHIFLRLQKVKQALETKKQEAWNKGDDD